MVESASLLTRYGFIAHHGFESHTLRILELARDAMFPASFVISFMYMNYVVKQKGGVLTIPKKALFGIAPAVAIIGLLLSKGDIGPLILFIVGIGSGTLIGKGFFECDKQ